MNKSLVNELAALFYPHACVVCGAELLENEDGVCLKCLYQLPRTHNYLERENEAEQHMAARISFERIATYCVYSKGGMLEPLIHHLKYHGKKEIGLLLGRLFGSTPRAKSSASAA